MGLVELTSNALEMYLLLMQPTKKIVQQAYGNLQVEIII